MAYKLIHATDARVGTVIIIDGEPCTVKSFDISRPGKHGHAKVRLGAVGITDGKKRILAKPGHDKLEVPMIEKKRAQILSVGESTVNAMDTESYETLDIPYPKELKGELKEEVQVEYWDIEGTKIVKRIL